MLSADGRWRSKSGDYAVAWQAIGSALAGGAPRAEPDGIPIEPGHAAGGAPPYVAKEGGPHWLWSVWQHVTGRAAGAERPGLSRAQERLTARYTLSYRTLAPLVAHRRDAHEPAAEPAADAGRPRPVARAAGQHDRHARQLLERVRSRSTARADYYDDREMGDGSALQRPGGVGAALSVSTRSAQAGDRVADRRRRPPARRVPRRLHGQLTLRLLPQLQIDLVPTVGSDSGRRATSAATRPPCVIGAPADYRFGVQTAVSAGATVRAAYTFTPDLSLQFYTQLFLARVDYGAVLRLPQHGGPRARRPRPR